MSFNYGAKIAAKNWWHAHRLSVKVKEPQPGVAKARVIFAGLSHSGFRRGGKVTAKEYLPPFCDVLRKHGNQTFFATSLLGLKLRLRQDIPTVIVMIYREVGFIPEQDGLSDILRKAQVVYNHPDMGRIIANKSATNDILSNRGVPMPVLKSVGEAEGAVFSNAETDTGAEVYLLEAGDALDPARYNTRFIDTRRTHNDETYHVSVRLMCINDEITHTLVRARNVSEGSPSVHNKDTPIDSHLVNEFYNQIVPGKMTDFRKVASSVFRAIGPGFYAHDLLIESSSGKVFLAETGYKFNDSTFCKRMQPVLAELLGISGFSTPEENAINSAAIFVRHLEGQLSSPRAI